MIVNQLTDLKKFTKNGILQSSETYNIVDRKTKEMLVMMKKVFELSYEINGYDSDLVEMMETFGTITLIDTKTHPIPVWAKDDEYYIPRQTLTYEWNIHPQYEKLATNLYNLAFGNDLLN